MNQSREPSVTLDDETKITLGVLKAVEDNNAVTQRSMAHELDIALGLANAYLKRCVKKGFVKIKQAPRNRYLYYLTPKGFAEKSRLTTRYLAISFDFFRSTRQQISDLLRQCETRGWRRVAFCGMGEMAEIGAICALDMQIDVVGIVDSAADKDKFAGLSVFPDPAQLGNVDVLIVTDLTMPQATYDRVVQTFPKARVLVPRLLNVATA